MLGCLPLTELATTKIHEHFHIRTSSIGILAAERPSTRNSLRSLYCLNQCDMGEEPIPSGNYAPDLIQTFLA